MMLNCTSELSMYRPLAHRPRAIGLLPSARHLALLLLYGQIALCIATTTTAAQEQPARDDRYTSHIVEASQRFGLPSAWIRAVIRVESAGHSRAVSSKGARGLMQIMPRTWRELRSQLKLGADPFDPRDNILAGTAYLRQLYDRYGKPGFLAAYNAGPARYESSLAGRRLPAETRAYVARLLPLVEGGPLGGVPTALALPRRWQDAPLFIAFFQSIASANSAQPESNSAVTADNPTTRGNAAVAPRSRGLFVNGGSQ